MHDQSTYRPYRHNVAAGIAFLQDREPGAVHQIDAHLLDLADPWRCPLGQTWAGIPAYSETYGVGPFAAHAEHLFGNDAQAVYAHGFSVPPLGADDGDVEELAARFAALTGEWRRQLRDLRCETRVLTATR